MITKTSFCYTPETQQARHVEKNDRIAMLEPDLERASEVAIHDPRITTRQLIYGLYPLIVRRFRPSRSPVKCVEVFDRDVKQFTEARGKRRFPGSARTDYEHLSHVWTRGYAN